MGTPLDHPPTLEPGTPQPTREPPTGPAKLALPTQPRRSGPAHATDSRRDLVYPRDQSRPPSPSKTRDCEPNERRESLLTTMPPPTIPSPKPSALELRETAKMTMNTRLPDRPGIDKFSQHDQNGYMYYRRSDAESESGQSRESWTVGVY